MATAGVCRNCLRNRILRYGVCLYCSKEIQSVRTMILMMDKKTNLVKKLRHEKRLLTYQLQLAKNKLSRLKSKLKSSH